MVSMIFCDDEVQVLGNVLASCMHFENQYSLIAPVEMNSIMKLKSFVVGMFSTSIVILNQKCIQKVVGGWGERGDATVCVSIVCLSGDKESGNGIVLQF